MPATNEMESTTNMPNDGALPSSDGFGFSIPFLRGLKDVAVDVLRHEFGHALADLYPGALKKDALFCKAFGGAYGDKPARGADLGDWEDSYVSGYATESPREDFAETFMLFVKHEGKIPARFANKPAIRKKWKAVEKIVRRVRLCSR